MILTYNTIIKYKCRDTPFSLEEYGISLDPVKLQLATHYVIRNMLIPKEDE